jgi:hypothetical protein
MTTETDKQFVERMQKHFEVYVSSSSSISASETDRLLALALRGAETQWRPIEEAPDNETLLVRLKHGYIDTRFAANTPHDRFTHFIPLTALGEPKDE